jgi:GxxExxY protein
MLHEALTETIIGAFYRVYNGLGYGFLEKVYENAMMIELAEHGFQPMQQERVKVFYKGAIVGDYFADIIINDKVILELKAAESLCDEHAAQLTNYLKATDKELGLLLNFGRKPEFRRIIFSDKRLVPHKV